MSRNSGNALIVVVVGAVATGAVTLATTKLTQEEKPPTCPGQACDGRNPEDEGCGSDAAGWKPATGNPVELEVRYSVRCGAAWGRINKGEPGDRLTARAVGGPVREATINYGDDQFTRMVAIADPKDFRIEVCALPTSKPDRKTTWERYCIHATETTVFR
ncbi:DUF2690 domain-containing protein [Streptomyces sp. TS71-3]|uniref:DUF2690 domain-containing protein n=1 Tax=Streptomyces sp. TS71-3 TaxID=2733862 RepID=UPI001BB419E6|nr:DUF2690 domain-containing protein [Streptomyces sp. TS71-3]